MATAQPLLRADKERVIDEDLYNELRWMVVAAVTWLSPNRPGRPRHLKVLAMDSALLHARSLYVFLSRTKRNSQYSDEVVCGDFGVDPAPVGKVWPELKDGVDARLFHIRRDRPIKDPVKDAVEPLVDDVLAMWKDFGVKLAAAAETDLASRCTSALGMALDEGDAVARTLGGHNPFR